MAERLDKKKNMKTNVAYGFVSKTLSILIPFLVRTVVIKVLSEEYLGLDSLFVSVLRALNLAELGLGNALVYNMYEPVASGDKKRLGQYLNFYRLCYRFIGLFILTAGLIMLPFIKHFIKGSYPADINIYLLYLIYLINTVLSYWLFAYKNSVALAYQRTDIESRAAILTNILSGILQMILLVLFRNYYVFALVLPAITIIKNLVVSRFIDKNFKDVRPEGHISKKEIRSVMSNVGALFGHQVAFTVVNSADNIIISALLGLNKLAVYNNYFYIFQALNGLLVIMFQSIQAGIGNSILLDDKEEVMRFFKKFRFMIFFIVGFCTSCLMNIYQPFMMVWMGKKLMLPDISTVCFAAAFYITQTRKVITTYKNAAGMWKADFLKPFVVIAVDIIIDFLLIKKVGSTGAVIATAISMGLIAVPWECMVLFKKLFKTGLMEHLLFVLRQTIITAFACAVCFVSCRAVTVQSAYVSLILCAAITSVLSFLIISVLNLPDKNEREIFRSLCRRFKLKK